MLDLEKNQQKIFVVMALVIFVLLGLLIFQEFFNNRDSVIPIGEESSKIEDISLQSAKPEEIQVESDQQQEPFKICVYVTGAVAKPGIITLKEGSRLAEALELAGGALEDADLNRVNLALKVEDEGMYIIPRIGEIAEEPIIVQSNISVNKVGDDGKVNINKADSAVLETLPGIGPSKAARIIEYREVNGSFKNIEEIMNVSGIGEKTYENIKDMIDIK